MSAKFPGFPIGLDVTTGSGRTWLYSLWAWVSGLASQTTPASVTVGASPFTHTAGELPEMIYIRGGTVSSVEVSGVTVFTASPCTVRLLPKQSVKITYTVAPTVVSALG